ncbi:peptide-methionine (R)-S-oxide reductase MsrB [Rhodovulum steppense]|uniref:peptide-methionine (R)-S-oxide reductase n=1 Tax=Rhodovulum steppense TaxID=540251 RepID=A0A4R1YKZ0_9RHOB|nr:peptide-methionine (R)-S-oxide reductase MsrB [Rhodovulum steppense]TCM77820.1 peptide-methionine (R)-S-oxide reductase [Rhodovulum steppense]
MNRRSILLGGAAVALTSRAARASMFEITRSEAEWRAMLDDLEYRVMRQEGTERAFTSPLNDEKRPGLYHCRGCELPLYDAATKFDSGTGWPSFWQALPDAVGTKPDRKFLMLRTEVHCRRCGSHLGHIFDDGPPPTDKRHCINGVSLLFRPAEGA